MIDFQQEDRTQQRVIGAAATFAYAALVRSQELGHGEE